MGKLVDSLKEKRASLVKEQSKLQARIAEDNALLLKVNQALAGVDALLRYEGAIDSTPAAPSSATPASSTDRGVSSPQPSKLYTVLHDTLADGQEHTISELVGTAKRRGVDFGEKEPYRTVAFTLMGIARGKTIERIGGDTWRLARAAA